MLTEALLTKAKGWKQSKSPSPDKSMKKMWYMHALEYNSAIKSKALIYATTLINHENSMLR